MAPAIGREVLWCRLPLRAAAPGPRRPAQPEDAPVSLESPVSLEELESLAEVDSLAGLASLEVLSAPDESEPCSA